MLLPIRSTPGLHSVDSEIFTLRYFMRCMQCTFCHDSCCQYGCDVNFDERERLLAVRAELEAFLGVPASEWFKPEVFEDPDYPSGRFVRANVRHGACVFLNRGGRGCGIHAFALKTGRDYHALKPMVCWLFPVTWDRGVMRPNSDVRDDLACANTGPTLYAGARDELRVHFGEALVAELDALEAKVAAGALAASETVRAHLPRPAQSA
jgi:Fe-S-cluster containining protein